MARPACPALFALERAAVVLDLLEFERLRLRARIAIYGHGGIFFASRILGGGGESRSKFVGELLRAKEHFERACYELSIDTLLDILLQ